MSDQELQYARNGTKDAKEAGTMTSIIYSGVTMTGKYGIFTGWGQDSGSM